MPACQCRRLQLRRWLPHPFLCGDAGEPLQEISQSASPRHDLVRHITSRAEPRQDGVLASTQTHSEQGPCEIIGAVGHITLPFLLCGSCNHDTARTEPQNRLHKSQVFLGCGRAGSGWLHVGSLPPTPQPQLMWLLYQHFFCCTFRPSVRQFDFSWCQACLERTGTFNV